MKKTGRRQGRRQNKQQSGLEGASQGLSNLNSCEPVLKECIKSVRNHTRINMAKTHMKNLHGKYNPVAYRPEYCFEERWESAGEATEFDKSFSTWKKEGTFLNAFQLGIVICYSLIIWFLSMHRAFDLGKMQISVTILAMVVQLVEVVCEELMSPQKSKATHVSLKVLLKKHFFSIMFFLYLWQILIEALLTDKSLLFLIVVDLVFLLNIYSKTRKIYLKLKIKLPSSWRYEVEIGQLIGGCLMLVHLFSVVLFLAASSDSTQNWTLSIDSFNRSWGHQYLYSLYFTCSTMFTVGYGDVTPKNSWQILTILMVQVIGIINIGYVINEVGRLLSKMNEGQEMLYRGISDAQKLSTTYKMPEELSKKVVSYVINNQIANNRLNVEEEDNFLMKLNQQVREDVTAYHKFQLVKNNIFFICHWTKRFQQRIAAKLVRQVYSPDDLLPQLQGKQRIYLLSRGKLHIEADFFSKKQPFSRKKLAVIEVKPEKEVQFGVYGYVSLISGLKVKLQAVARDYSICYVVEKEEFKAAAAQLQPDSQYYHQIRSKIEESSCKEAFEAPLIKSSKQLYQPNVYFIIKRKTKQESRVQSRKHFLRIQNKRSFVIQADVAESQKEIEAKMDELNSLKQVSIDQKILVTSQFIAEPSSKRLIKSNGEICMLNLSERSLVDKKTIIACFQTAREFQRFRPKFNKNKMLQNYSRLFHKKGSQQIIMEQYLLRTTRKLKNDIDEQGIKKIINSKTF